MLVAAKLRAIFTTNRIPCEGIPGCASWVFSLDTGEKTGYFFTHRWYLPDKRGESLVLALDLVAERAS